MSLCERVETGFRKTLGDEQVARWEFEAAAEFECRVATDEFLLIFHVDDRETHLMSSITFLNQGEWLEERLYVNAIAKILPYFGDYSYQNDSHESALSRDIGAITNILSLVNSGKLSPRDLLYFSFGFNNGYSNSE